MQVIVKPSASLSPNVRLDGFIQHGRHRITGDAIDAFFPIESSNDLWNPQTNWNTHSTWVLGDRTVVEGRYGGYDARSWLDPHPPAGLDGPYPRFDTGTQTWSQNTNWYLRTETAIQTASASVMHQADHFLGGPHELKVGLEYETTRAWQQQRYPGGRNHYDSFGVPVEVHVWAGFAGRATTGRNVLHAQDSWPVTNRLTVSPGLRVEWNRGSVPARQNVYSNNDDRSARRRGLGFTG